jgi:hypothetical protein
VSCVTEHKADNARLHMELEQDHRALAEADAARSSLFASLEKLEWHCTGLCATVDELMWEKAHVVTNCEADVAAE